MARYFYRPGHPKASANGFVSQEDMGWEPEPLAKNAPILAGRFYENVQATDGTDIGSRQKRKDYMKAMQVTDMGDFSPEFYAKQKAEHFREDDRARREAIGRAAYEVERRR